MNFEARWPQGRHISLPHSSQTKTFSTPETCTKRSIYILKSCNQPNVQGESSSDLLLMLGTLLRHDHQKVSYNTTISGLHLHITEVEEKRRESEKRMAAEASRLREDITRLRDDRNRSVHSLNPLELRSNPAAEHAMISQCPFKAIR